MDKLKPGIMLSLMNVAQGWIASYTVQGENIPHIVPGCFPNAGDAIKGFTAQWETEREKANHA